MENELISIIIPIYDTKDYLEKCLKSIIKQTYSNLEIILVNNIEKEGTKEICEEYAKKDKRIKVINTSNVSVGEARNIGLRKATGEYIGFVDSDDYIERDMYEMLLRELKENDAEIATIGYVREEEDGTREKRKFTDKIKVLKKDKALEDLLKDKYVQSYVWNKLFKKEIWKDLYFDKERVLEDIDIMYKLFERVEKIVTIDTMKYIYVQRSTSIMHEHNSSFVLDRLYVVLDRYEYLKNEECPKIQFMNKYAFAVNMIVMYRKIVLEDYDDIYDEFMKYIDMFMNIIHEYEEEIRKILTKNQNLVLDFMLEDLKTAPEKIKSVKGIEK